MAQQPRRVDDDLPDQLHELQHVVAEADEPARRAPTNGSRQSRAGRGGRCRCTLKPGEQRLVLGTQREVRRALPAPGAPQQQRAGVIEPRHAGEVPVAIRVARVLGELPAQVRQALLQRPQDPRARQLQPVVRLRARDAAQLGFQSGGRVGLWHTADVGVRTPASWVRPNVSSMTLIQNSFCIL